MFQLLEIATIERHTTQISEALSKHSYELSANATQLVLQLSVLDFRNWSDCDFTTTLDGRNVICWHTVTRTHTKEYRDAPSLACALSTLVIRVLSAPRIQCKLKV